MTTGKGSAKIEKKVLVFGTFDIFHPGHRNFLKQARSYGNWLRVVIARDQTVLKVKQHRPVNQEQARLAAVRQTGLADEVVLGNLKKIYKVIKDYEPDVICLGYDQRFFVSQLDSKLKEFKLTTEVKLLKPYKPEIYKSSKLKNENFTWHK